MPLSHDEIHGYLKRLSLDSQEPDLPYLNDLIHAQLATVPYENLSIHYSETHSISLDLDTLFKKIVTNRHGGYCMELNALFAALLTGLGFDVHHRAGRVWKVGSPRGPEGEANSKHWTGWSHMVLIVRLEKDYLVDVGYGSNGPVTALCVPPKGETGPVVPGVVPEEHQLATISAPHSPSHSVYILRHRRNSTSLWTPLFEFDSFTPFSSSDYEIMSFHSHSHPSSPFVSNVVCTTVIFDQDGTAINRILLQNNVLKERKKGTTVVSEKFDSEDARLDAIERVWGIKFTDSERKGVEKWKVGITGPGDEKSIPIAGWS